MKTLLAALTIALPLSVYGHGGGLDSNGGHYNRSTGTYHYHRAKPKPQPIPKPPVQVVRERKADASDTEASAKTDDEIKKALVRDSISRYSGSCPCPYNTDRAGRRCGARSAYSRPGGASPLCYDSDVTQSMVDAYRTRFSVPKPEKDDSKANN